VRKYAKNMYFLKYRRFSMFIQKCSIYAKSHAIIKYFLSVTAVISDVEEHSSERCPAESSKCHNLYDLHKISKFGKHRDKGQFPPDIRRSHPSCQGVTEQDRGIIL
jgi:hypothetical protein